MMADLMYQRNEGEQAIKHFSQILDRNPSKLQPNLPTCLDQYHALARCVELSWRKGDMEQVDKVSVKALYDKSLVLEKRCRKQSTRYSRCRI